MHQATEHSSSKLDKVMKPEQFNQIVEAILAGKYSWACVLILRFAEYNPLHYIPYRTYNRLMKENRQLNGVHCNQNESFKTNNRPSQSTFHATAAGGSSKITDLAYVEKVSEKSKLRGGTRVLASGFDWRKPGEI